MPQEEYPVYGWKEGAQGGEDRGSAGRIGLAGLACDSGI